MGRYINDFKRKALRVKCLLIVGCCATVALYVYQAATANQLNEEEDGFKSLKESVGKFPSDDVPKIRQPQQLGHSQVNVRQKGPTNVKGRKDINDKLTGNKAVVQLNGGKADAPPPENSVKINKSELKKEVPQSKMDTRKTIPKQDISKNVIQPRVNIPGDQSRTAIGRPLNANADVNSNEAIGDFSTFPCVNNLSRHSKTVCVRGVPGNIPDVKYSYCGVESLDMPHTVIHVCRYDRKGGSDSATAVKRLHKWYMGNITALVNLFKITKQLQYLDVGCDIGGYVITAARYLKKVVCVDASLQNLRMVSTALNIEKTRGNVKLIWNAVSGSRGFESIKSWRSVLSERKLPKEYVKLQSPNYSRKVTAVKLDDLQGLFTAGNDVFVRLDASADELAVLKSGKEFFKQLRVVGIKVNFIPHRTQPSGKEIGDFFTNLGFAPYADIHGKSRLDRVGYLKWPTDVYFLKR